MSAFVSSRLWSLAQRTCLAVALLAIAAGSAQAQFISQAVGGVFIDANGVLFNQELAQAEDVRQWRLDAMQPVPGDLEAPAQLRKVSLRGLEELLAQCVQNNQPIPDAARYLAGLQRIEYVLVYPDQQDIVLAGFAEGWRVDERGNVVGETTGRPVLLLDDLLVALRNAEQSAQGGISCSIDPTAEGLQRLQSFIDTRPGMSQETIGRIEQELGPQTITLTNVPPMSHFARVLVAADYRMKRLAMAFEESPVDGLPSYLSMAKAGSGMSNMLPRWWLATNYDALLRDAEGLSWKLRGPGVKAMAEDDFLAENGERVHTGRASAAGQRWANNMTEHYEDLSVAEPIFGELRNIMDLSVIAALLVKENLIARANLSTPTLFDEERLPTDQFFVPQQVDSRATFVKKGRNWLISASGGVMIHPWGVADVTEVAATTELQDVRSAAQLPAGVWWWN